MDGYCRVYTMLHLVERRRMEEGRTKKMSVNDINLVSKHNFAAILSSKTHFCPTLPPQNIFFCRPREEACPIKTRIKQ